MGNSSPSSFIVGPRFMTSGSSLSVSNCVDYGGNLIDPGLFGNLTDPNSLSGYQSLVRTPGRGAR